MDSCVTHLSRPLFRAAERADGTYKVIDQSDESLTLQRRTGDGKYTDKMTFTFASTSEVESGMSKCVLRGCSESQVTSVADFSTNYCNLFMLYCGSKDGCKPVSHDIPSQLVEAKPSFGAGKDPKACLVNV